MINDIAKAKRKRMRRCSRMANELSRAMINPSYSKIRRHVCLTFPALNRANVIQSFMEARCATTKYRVSIG
jgi:hypothetical protein